MKRFQFRLQIALDQALRLEERAALALAEATSERDTQVQHLHALARPLPPPRARTERVPDR